MMSEIITKHKTGHSRFSSYMSSATIRRKIILMIVGLITGLIFLFPLYWLAINSFKTDLEIFSGLTFYPHIFTVKPWVEQLTSRDFLASLRNSFFIATISMMISFVLGVSAAYGLARFAIKGKAMVLLVFLVTQMMPSSLLLTPLFLTFSRFNLLNSYSAPVMAIASGSVPFIVITLRPYFSRLPK